MAVAAMILMVILYNEYYSLRQDVNDYGPMGHQRPLAEDDDPDRWFRYRPPAQSGVADQLGKRFNVNRSRLKWDLNDINFVSLTPDVLTQFVVATAASSFFYQYSLAAIATVQTHLPNHTIFFYDLSQNRKSPTNNDLRQKRKNPISQQVNTKFAK